MKKYVITSYTQGSELSLRSFEILKNYCTINDAELIVGLCAPINKKDINLVDSSVAPYLLTKNTPFNNSLLFLDQRLNPSTLDHVAGFDAVANARGSLVLATPRHRFKSVARSLKHSDSPRGIWCTGSISIPSYVSNKAGLKAEELHKMGALVISIENEEVFHIRQLSISDDGLYDLDWKYTETIRMSSIPSALVLGDLHPPFTNQGVLEATKQLISELSPNHVVYHDVFDAATISHHVEGKSITKAKIFKEMKTLKDEIDLTWNILDSIRKSHPLATHSIVRSNHDEHLDRYLEEGRYLKDYINHDTAIDIIKLKKDGYHTLEAALSLAAGFDTMNFDYLNRVDTLTISGIECANHGDYGANGGKGSTSQHGLAFNGKVVTGHSHSSEIGVYGNYIVGTMTDLSLPYTNDSGTSGWLNTHVIIYPDGNMTHIHLIKKK